MIRSPVLVACTLLLIGGPTASAIPLLLDPVETMHDIDDRLPAEEERAPAREAVVGPAVETFREVNWVLKVQSDPIFEKYFFVYAQSNIATAPVRSSQTMVASDAAFMEPAGLGLHGTHQTATQDEQQSRPDVLPVPEGSVPGGDDGMQTATARTASTDLYVGAALLPIAIGLFLAALFSRLHANQVADHPIRRRMLDLIENEPGIRIHEIAERLDMNPSHVNYHGRMLIQHEIIKAESRARALHYFPAGSVPDERRERVATFHPKTAQVYEAVCKSGAARLSDIQEQVGISPSLASWHLKRLQREGIVVAHKQGRTLYRPSKPALSSA